MINRPVARLISDAPPDRRRSPLIDRVQTALHRPERDLLGGRPWSEARADAAASTFRMARTMDAATAFLLDDDFVAAAMHAAESPADITLAALASARPPADVTWVEWSERARLAAVAAGDMPDAGLDGGALIEALPDRPGQWTATIFWAQQGVRRVETVVGMAVLPPGKVSVCPVAVQVSTTEAAAEPSSRYPLVGAGLEIRADAAARTEIRRDGIASLGRRNAARIAQGMEVSTVGLIGTDWSEAQPDAGISALATRVRATVSPGWIREAGPRSLTAPTTASDALAHHLLREATRAIGGDVRFLIAVLAMLNARRIAQREATRSRGTSREIGTRRVTVPPLDLVRLVAPREIVQREYRRIVRAAAARARHPVIGHWAERRATRSGCDHVWAASAAGTTATLQTCSSCGHRRWWRSPHERGQGDGSLRRRFRVVTSSP